MPNYNTNNSKNDNKLRKDNANQILKTDNHLQTAFQSEANIEDGGHTNSILNEGAG